MAHIEDTENDTNVTRTTRFERLIETAFYSGANPSHFQRAALIAAMLHTRDITNGQGQYADFYRLVIAFDNIIDRNAPTVSRQKTETMRVLLQKIVASCVYMNGYGSWKDMKYLLNHLRDAHGEEAAARKPIFKYIVSITSNQLKLDAQTQKQPQTQPPTLAGKWAPREKSKKFGWQAKYLALYWHPEWCGGTLDVKDAEPAALKKCLTHYRKQIAHINRALKTPQINQCAHAWSSIDFETNVSRTTMTKQGVAFKNTMNCGRLRTDYGDTSDYNDRMRCRANYLATLHRLRSQSANRGTNRNTSLYDTHYDWVWNDPLICHSHS